MILVEILCATCAGCASTLVGHPLDTIKVHLQTNQNLLNPTNAARSLLQQSSGNPFVFFRGIAPPLVNAVIMNTVMFSVFQSVKGALPENTAAGALTAGVLSGIATAFLSTPADYVKIQSQLGGMDSTEVLRRIFGRVRPKGGPLRSLFRGHSANLGREGVFTMVYLGLYDQLLTGGAVGGGGADYGLLRVAMVSSMTGGLAWVVSYPFDTIKTVMQGSSIVGTTTTNATNTNTAITFRSTVRSLWKINGYKAFYKGCGASTGRAILVTSMRMIVYEFIKSLF